MSARPSLIAIAIGSALLAGCATSPPTHYFTLAAIRGADRESHPIPTPITVAAVTVPRALDRQALVRRTGPTTVEVSDQDRWVAPLGDLIRQTLSEDLASRVPPGKLVPPDAPTPPDSAKLVVTIDEFGVSPGGRVALNGSWSLLKPGQNTPRVQRTFEFETPADGGASEQAAAMSELLGRLASAIAQTLAGGG